LDVFTPANRFASILLVGIGILTAILVGFPTSIVLRDYPVQSLIAIQSMNMFAVTYLIWMALISLALLTTRGEQTSDWYYLVIILLFSIVNIEFWTIKRPLGLDGDPLFQIAGAKYLLANGHLVQPTAGVTAYYDFPGLAFIAVAISQILHLSFISVEVDVAFIQGLFFPLVVYVLFNRYTHDKFLATLGVMFAIFGNILLGSYNNYHPSSLGLLVFLPLVLLQIQLVYEGTHKTKMYLLLILSFFAVVISHFITSALIVFIIFSVYIWKKNTPKLFLMTIFVVFGTWLVYSEVTFGSVIYTIIQGASDLTTGWLAYLSLGINSRIGQRVPYWVSVDTLFWLVFVYGLPLIISLHELLVLRKTRIEVVQLGAVILLVVLTLIPYPTGVQIERFFIYAPFFTIPILIKTEIIRRISFRTFGVLLVILLVALSFPTFLVQNSDVSINTLYQSDVNGALFLSRGFGSGAGLSIYSNQNSVYEYFLPMAANYYVTEFTYTSPNPRQLLIDSLNSLLSGFVSSHEESVFVYSKWFMIFPHHYLGISNNDPIWTNLYENLSLSNLIYESSGNSIAIYYK